MSTFIERIRNADLPLWVHGIALTDWVRVVAGGGRPRRGKAAFAKATLLAARNSGLRLVEQARYGARIRRTQPQPPIVLLGFWRSGTTHLHNLFAVDDRFAVPNHFEVCNPHTFLTTEDRAFARFGTERLHKRPQDNLLTGLFSPAEDEIALAAMTLTGVNAGAQPSDAASRIGRFLTLRDASEAERTRWKAALVQFVRKLTIKRGRPIVLKSPPHTARVRLLLEAFPDARFVHISRHPHSVLPSHENMLRKLSPELSEADWPGVRDEIVAAFAEMYRCYFEDRETIPEGRLVEIAFEDLERDPIGRMRHVYRALDLPDFAEVEARVADYAESVGGYRKNAFPELEPELAARLAVAWRPYFEAWDYAGAPQPEAPMAAG